MFVALTTWKVKPGAFDEALAVDEACGTSPFAVERLTLADRETNTITVLAFFEDEEAARGWPETDHGRAVHEMTAPLGAAPLQRTIHRLHRRVKRG